MEKQDIRINGVPFSLETTLHPGIYLVSSEGQSALIGKDEKGEWMLTLQTGGDVYFPTKEIGAAINQLPGFKDNSPKL